MHLPLWILRAFFFLVVLGLALSHSLSLPVEEAGAYASYRWAIFFWFLCGAVVIIIVDVVIAQKRIDLISSVYFGLVVGLFLTYIVSLALTPLFESFSNSPVQRIIPPETMKSIVVSFLGAAISYACVSLLWQTKDDFRFVIPYVEFSKDLRGAKPYVLDTSAVIDGRIADIVETGMLDNQLVMPRFALVELQAIADSSDKLRRARGRRGLDILNRLRSNDNVDFKIYDRELPEMKGQPVDLKLLTLAKHLGGKVVTGDYNLNKVAKLHNVPVVNLNEIANALKPVFLPGETIRVKLVKTGEGLNQGVGYMDDGTMIVVEDGRNFVGSQVEISITSMLQTNAGRMVFGKFERTLG
ncbi:MAG TPA: PIN/TRAM domain-containing protein [Pirellulaceae bacterium]|nr:PIN/TRAM domain-containing protein [Pirellulaceae bacterium]